MQVNIEQLESPTLLHFQHGHLIGNRLEIPIRYDFLIRNWYTGTSQSTQQTG